MQHRLQFAAFGVALAMWMPGPGWSADAETRALTTIVPTDAAACLNGETRFRGGDFEAAREAFQAAIAANPSNARAWWGLGRIEQIHFRPTEARDLFARAYRLSSRDSDIILSYAGMALDRDSRATLLRNVAVLSRTARPDRAALALAQLEIEDRLAGRVPGALASPYAPYRLAGSGFHPAGAVQHGLTILATINGTGKPLRLVLDTGARGLLVHARAARGLGLDPIVESRLGGFGAGGTGASTVSLARTVSFGKLEYRDCLVEVSEREVASDADGIVGVGLFEQFRIRIDARSRSVELTPFDAAPPDPGAVSAVGLNKLLLVRTRIAGVRDGLFLLDTGSAFTSVAREVAPWATDHLGSMDLGGVQGSVASAFRLAPMALEIGGRAMTETQPVALDLRTISQREGVEISGILGYSTLSRYALTIDFRSGLVDFGKSGER